MVSRHSRSVDTLTRRSGKVIVKEALSGDLPDANRDEDTASPDEAFDANTDETSDEEVREMEEIETGVRKEEEEGEEEEEDIVPRKKRLKIGKHDDGSAGFSDAMNAILSSHLKAYDRDDPIMARNKRLLKKNESDKLERQAKRALLIEKKKKLNRVRRKDIIPQIAGYSDETTGEEIRAVLEKEAKLRKIARKGAVKLFNAILSTQVDRGRDSKILTNFGQKERKQRLTDLSKDKFLDLVKTAGEHE